MGNLVSVIIPTYKRPFKVLERAINSVLSQSHTDIELVIIDDSPPHDPMRKEIELEISRITDERVKYIQHENNQGACKARNTGIINSKGEYIAFLDDDDEWLPKKIEEQLKRFSDKSVGLVYCDAYIVTMHRNLEKKIRVRAKRISGFVYNDLIMDNFIGSTSFVMLKRNVLEDVGKFDNELLSAQDYELWLRISKKYKIDYADEPLVRYYIHEGERISTNVHNKIQGFERLNQLNEDYLESNKKANCLRNLELAPFYARRDGVAAGIKCWLKAVKDYPFHRKCLISFIKIFVQRKKV